MRNLMRKRTKTCREKLKNWRRAVSPTSRIPARAKAPLTGLATEQSGAHFVASRIRFGALTALHLLEKPRSGESPIIFYRRNRDAQNLCYFFIRPARKIAKLNDLCLDWIFPGQFVQSFIHGQ